MEKASTSSSQPKKTKTGPSGFLKSYLVAYNIASLTGWAYVLYLAIVELVTSKTHENVFEATWPALTIVQTTALFEILHALLGWVRTPFLTTLMQVLSRILLVWFVNYPFPQIHSHWSYSTMIISWSIAEIVRYSYYATNLLGSVPSIITWARYSFFQVLYPTGISSEVTMVLQALPYIKQQWGDLYYYIYIAILVVYVPGAPFMFNHMRAQRKKYFKSLKQDEKKTT